MPLQAVPTGMVRSDTAKSGVMMDTGTVLVLLPSLFSITCCSASVRMANAAVFPETHGRGMLAMRTRVSPAARVMPLALAV